LLFSLPPSRRQCNILPHICTAAIHLLAEAEGRLGLYGTPKPRQARFGEPLPQEPPKLTSCVSGNPFSSPPDCHSLPRRRFATPSGDDICLLFGGGGSRRLTEGGLLYSYFSFSPTPSRLHRDTPPKEGALVCAASMPVRRKSLFGIIPLRRLRRHLSQRERLKVCRFGNHRRGD